jgi:hypothetical protein
VRPLSNVEKAQQKFNHEDKSGTGRVDMIGFFRLSDTILTKITDLSKREKRASDCLTFPKLGRFVKSW